MVNDGAARFRPVDRAKLLGQHRRKRHAALVLRRPRRRARLHRVQRVAEQWAAKPGEALQQALRVFIRVDRRFADLDDVARIERRRHIHGRDARLPTAVEDRPLDRPRAAQLGQNARVDVHAAERRNIQHALRQNFSVCHDGDRIRAQGTQLLDHRIVAEGRRLKHGQSGGERNLFDLAHLQLHAAIFRLIGLCIDADDLKIVRKQSLQTGCSDVGRPHKDNSHASLSIRISSSSSSVSRRDAISV